MIYAVDRDQGAVDRKHRIGRSKMNRDFVKLRDTFVHDLSAVEVRGCHATLFFTVRTQGPGGRTDHTVIETLKMPVAHLASMAKVLAKAAEKFDMFKDDAAVPMPAFPVVRSQEELEWFNDPAVPEAEKQKLITERRDEFRRQRELERARH